MQTFRPKNSKQMARTFFLHVAKIGVSPLEGRALFDAMRDDALENLREKTTTELCEIQAGFNEARGEGKRLLIQHELQR